VFIYSLLVGIGGFLGAMARFALSNIFNEGHSFPFGTVIVNLVGSFLLGVLAGNAIGYIIYLLVGVGFMGAFTTFSTLTLDVITLWKKRQWQNVIIYLSLTYIGGLGLAFVGFAIYS